MSDETLDEPVFERFDSNSNELLMSPRCGPMGEEKRGVALSVLWWVEASEAEDV